jgi:hypothetical protein
MPNSWQYTFVTREFNIPNPKEILISDSLNSFIPIWESIRDICSNY